MASLVMVVEDDEKSRRLLADVLRHRGYEVAAFESGEAALRVAAALSPRAALVDIQLPGMNGFDVLVGLRALCGNARLPVLAVTASAMDHDRRRILASGFDAYVAKPVNIRQLLETLDALVAQVMP